MRPGAPITSAFIAAVLFCGASSVSASENYVLAPVNEQPLAAFTNENWYSLPQPHVASFIVLDNGNFLGTTTTGVPFEQYAVPNDVGVRVERFQIQHHFHFIVSGHIVNTLETLSAQLALAYKALQ